MNKTRILSALMLSTIVLAQVVPVVAQTQAVLEVQEAEKVVATPVAETGDLGEVEIPLSEPVEEVEVPELETVVPPVQEEPVAEILPDVMTPAVTLPELVSPTFSGQDVGVLNAGVEATFGENISLDALNNILLLFPANIASLSGRTNAGGFIFEDRANIPDQEVAEFWLNGLGLQSGTYTLTIHREGVEGGGDSISFPLTINRARAEVVFRGQVLTRQHDGTSIANLNRLPMFELSGVNQRPQTNEAFENIHFIDNQGNPTANRGLWHIGGVDIEKLEEEFTNHSFGHITAFFESASIIPQPISVDDITIGAPTDLSREYDGTSTRTITDEVGPTLSFTANGQEHSVTADLDSISQFFSFRESTPQSPNSSDAGARLHMYAPFASDVTDFVASTFRGSNFTLAGQWYDHQYWLVSNAERFGTGKILPKTIQLIGEPEPYDFGRQFNNDGTIDTSEVDFELLTQEFFTVEGAISGERLNLQVAEDHSLAFESPYADGNNRLVGTGFGIVAGNDRTRITNYRLADSPLRARTMDENFIPVDVNKLLKSTTGITATEGVSVLPERVSASRDTIRVNALIDEERGHVAHERSEEVLADVQFTLYEENPSDTRSRVTGVSNNTGVFTGLEAGKQYYVTATSLASQNFEAGVASEAVPVSTTSTTPRPPEGETGGTDRENGGSQGNGTNDGNNQDNTNQSIDGQNVLKTSQNLPKAGDVATASATLLGIGSLLTALGLKKKSKK